MPPTRYHNSIHSNRALQVMLTLVEKKAQAVFMLVFLLLSGGPGFQKSLEQSQFERFCSSGNPL